MASKDGGHLRIAGEFTLFSLRQARLAVLHLPAFRVQVAAQGFQRYVALGALGSAPSPSVVDSALPVGEH